MPPLPASKSRLISLRQVPVLLIATIFKILHHCLHALWPGSLEAVLLLMILLVGLVKLLPSFKKHQEAVQMNQRRHASDKGWVILSLHQGSLTDTNGSCHWTKCEAKVKENKACTALMKILKIAFLLAFQLLQWIQLAKCFKINLSKILEYHLSFQSNINIILHVGNRKTVRKCHLG